MYKIKVTIENVSSNTKRVIVSCIDNDEGQDNNIFRITNADYSQYTSSIVLGPISNESIIGDRIKDAVEKAKDFIFKRRIYNAQSFSIII